MAVYKKSITLFIVVLLLAAIPAQVFAATGILNNYVLKYPDDMKTCSPTFNFELANAPADGKVQYNIGVVVNSSLTTIKTGFMAFDSSSGTFKTTYSTTIDTSGVYTYSIQVAIFDSSGVVLQQMGYKWEVTCDKTPPPPGGEGCTPGYWKQPQHLDSWVGFSPSDVYDQVFGISYFGDLTLLQSLEANGGGANALARHSTAALLNASNPDVAYDYSVAMVIAAVQQAFNTGNFEAYKDVFQYYNEQGCPLN